MHFHAYIKTNRIIFQPGKKTEIFLYEEKTHARNELAGTENFTHYYYFFGNILKHTSARTLTHIWFDGM